MRALNRIFASALAVCCALLGFSSAATAAPAKPAPRKVSTVPGQVLVKMRPGVDVAGAAGELGAKLGSSHAVHGWRLLSIPATASVDDAVAALRANPNVAEATANAVYHSFATADDSLLSSQWGVTKTSVESAWDKTEGSTSVIVGVVDTGIASDIPELAPNLVAGKDFTGSGTTYDGYGHGTHVAGIIAAANNDGLGVAGVAPSVKLMSLRALDTNGNGNTWWIAQAFAYAGTHGVKVVNASLGGSGDDPALEDAISGAPNTLFVVAAGNESSNNDSTPTYPCNSPAANVVCVAASTDTDGLASFSNYGKTTVDLAAPGEGIVSTYLPGAPASGSQMLSDSPAGSYQNGTDSWAQRSVDLSGQSSCTLSYVVRGRMASDDVLTAEQSDDGSTWSQVGSPFGPSATTHGSYVLRSGPLSTSSTLVRFHLVSDGSETDDGAYIDSVVVHCASGNVWTDGFESGLAAWSTGGTDNTWGTTNKAWTWVTMSGTSMATPFVTGAAALLWSYRPTSSVSRVKDSLIRSVSALSAFSGITVGGGRLNAARALTYVADTTAPSGVAMSSSALAHAFQTSPTFTIGWKATDTGSGLRSYDIRYQRARYNGGFGSWATWKSGTHSTSAAFTGGAGYTYCFQVRARDRMLNLSGWSASKCTAIPVDDRSLSASSGWTRSTSSYDFLDTHSIATSKGTWLKLSNVTVKRIGLLVRTCSGCGKVQVFKGSTLLGTFSLSTTTSSTRHLILVTVLSSVTAPVTITLKVVSSGASVPIDALALSCV